MYIKSMILDGFKSYGKRIEINGFDREFNAITGFNGSGKSNVLDAICFVLGITNLGQVRATTLQDLVYKSGQAGVKKATVTITFDNGNIDSSPLGYEQHKEITITRQVVIGGKNKYMINGINVPNKRVHDMFCSVQLNVNNPHFLIMQGRITKVLNMKPVEILSMIEEAAGTRMYENKKQEALKTIEKKDSKLKEINTILKEEIGPKLDKLKDERMQFVEFQRVERELEHCRRLYIAWRYVTALNNSQKAEKDVQAVQSQIDSMNECIRSGEEEVKEIDEKLMETRKRVDAEKGGKLETLEQSLQEAEKKQFKLQAEVNSNKESIKAAENSMIQIKANTCEDENMLTMKEKEFERVGGLFHTLKEMDQKDAEALKAAQERYQKISSGLLQSEDGDNATLEQQLISVKQTATQTQTEIKQCQMTLEHSKEQLKKKEKELLSTECEYKKDSKHLEDKEKELKNFENELKKLNYQDGSRENILSQRDALRREIQSLREIQDQFESRYPQMRFEYKDPEPNFDRSRVKGLVCTLLTIRDKKAAYALDVAAGGKLYNVIVDTDQTSKKLLQHGQLQQRVTIIPLNRVGGRIMPQQTVDFAQKLVGAENVRSAMSLIEYPEEIRSAMNWVFGEIFICKDMETAKRVAFHEKIMKKCVTLEGDVFDPAGTLSGGAPSKKGSILLQLDELKATQNILRQKERGLDEIEHNLRNVVQIADTYAALKEKYDLRSHEVNMVKQRLQQTVHHQIKEEVDALKASIAGMLEKMVAAKEVADESSKKAKELESQLKNSANIRERQLKEAEKELAVLKKKSEGSRKEWQKREQESETLELEIKELKKSIENSREQLSKAEEELVRLRNKDGELQEELERAKGTVKDLHSSLKEQKDIINQQNKEIQKLVGKKEDIIKQNKEAELDIKKLSHEINTIRNNAKDCKQKVAELEKKYEWIEQDKVYFGKAGGRYDFEANNPEDINRKLHHLESIHQNLSRNVNTRAMNLLDKEEEQYNEMLKKKKIVENDKIKILETIEHLDQKKKETLLRAWEQVSKDFGSIFSSLLPGAEAKLQPPENQTVMDGLEVKVGFSGVWKESLGELSGGQRSLVALSLILAMLLFKPAPLYILDEVDAALDLSHTENIGTMLKRHFKHSQFIVVSLKDGMFNNANVLFTTRFVDGMSTITRTERGKAS